MSYNHINHINFVNKHKDNQKNYFKSESEIRPIIEFNKNHNEFESNDELFPNFDLNIFKNTRDFVPDFLNKKDIEYHYIEIALSTLGITRDQYNLMNEHDFDIYKNNKSISTNITDISHAIYILIYYKKKEII